MTVEERRAHKRRSRNKWQRLAKHGPTAKTKLGRGDCGYCTIYYDERWYGTCGECPLTSSRLCARGKGRAYRAVAHASDNLRNGAPANIAGARAAAAKMLAAIDRDIAKDEEKEPTP